MKTAIRYLVLLFALSVVMAACDRNGGEDEEGTEGSEETEQVIPTYYERPPRCDQMCATPAPAADDYPRLIITHVYFGDPDWVTLRNLSGSEINLAGYHICSNGACTAMSEYVLPFQRSVTVRLGTPGVATEGVMLISDRTVTLEPNGELAIFASDNFDSASQLRAYVRWGTQAGADSYVNLAVDQELWLPTAFLQHCEEPRNGFYGVGGVNRPYGFFWGREECFE